MGKTMGMKIEGYGTLQSKRGGVRVSLVSSENYVYDDDDNDYDERTASVRIA